MKKLTFAASIFAAALAFSAVAATPTFALSESQKKSISENCASIKQTLRTVQKADSRTRVYLGSIYQIVLTNYMTPLNLRLVKNNQPNADLATLQSDFTTIRDQASQKFIIYSQHLEELLLIDCAKNPESFYQQLEKTRQQRNALSEVNTKIANILNNHIKIVTQLQEGRK